MVPLREAAGSLHGHFCPGPRSGPTPPPFLARPGDKVTMLILSLFQETLEFNVCKDWSLQSRRIALGGFKKYCYLVPSQTPTYLVWVHLHTGVPKNAPGDCNMQLVVRTTSVHHFNYSSVTNNEAGCVIHNKNQASGATGRTTSSTCTHGELWGIWATPVSPWRMHQHDPTPAVSTLSCYWFCSPGWLKWVLFVATVDHSGLLPHALLVLQIINLSNTVLH